MDLKTILKDLYAGFTALRPHMKMGRRLVVLVVVLAMVAGGLEATAIGLLLSLVVLIDPNGTETNAFLEKTKQWLPDQSQTFYVAIFCGAVIGAIFLKNAVMYSSAVFSAKMRIRIRSNIRKSFLRVLESAELYVFEENKGGSLVNAFVTESSRTVFTFDFLILALQRGAIMLFYFVTILVISWELTLMTALIGVLIGYALKKLYTSIKKQGQQLTRIAQDLFNSLMETFQGTRLIRATNEQKTQFGKCEKAINEEAVLDAQQTKYSVLLPGVTETLGILGAMIMFGLAFEFFVKTGQLSQTALMGFGFILLRMLPMANQLNTIRGLLTFHMSGMKEMVEWLKLPQHPTKPFGNKEFKGIRNTIEFKNLTYAYHTGTIALENISFELQQGKTLALVGSSGSGKTTLANLLLRFRSLTEGTVFVDGVDFWEFSPESWHKKVAVVEQEAYLFNDSLRHNIAFGFPEATDDQIWEALRKANLEELIRGYPKQLDTPIGERGTMLSGGQKQRLAIARALIRDPDILILDEATSALDTISEHQVQEALESAQEGRTVLVIAHRLSTVRHADHIVVLDEGRIVEQGSWEQLAANDGMFQELVKMSNLLH